MTPKETKHSSFLRLKFQAGSDENTIEGYGSVAGNVDSYGEVVMPGAFAKSLARHAAAGTSVKMLWQHDQTKPIGRWIEVREDNLGLYVKGVLNLASEAGREALAHVKGSDVDGLSIGFSVPAGGILADPANTGITRLKTIDLYEVSLVTFPANGRARVLGSKGELAALLRKELGLPAEAARRIADGGFPALTSTNDDQAAAELLRVLKASADRYGRR